MARTPRPWFWKQRNSWFVTIAGKRYDLGPERKAAVQRFHELMAEPKKRVISSDSVASIIDAFLEWTKNNRSENTFHWYLGFCQSFVSSIPIGLKVSQLKPFHVQTWVGQFQDSPATVRGKIGAVQRALRWGEQQGYISRSPIANIQKPRPQRRNQIISHEAFDMMLSHFSDVEFQDLLSVAWETGARPQELTRVEARHVDLKNSRWVFPPEEAKVKNHPRIVYLTEKALQITLKYTLKYPEGPLLRNTKSSPWTRTAANSRFQRLKAKTGVKYCLYAFRHSFATRLLEKGVDALTVAILLGHEDPSMLAKVYQHLSLNPGHLLKQVRRATG